MILGYTDSTVKFGELQVAGQVRVTDPSSSTSMDRASRQLSDFRRRQARNTRLRLKHREHWALARRPCPM